MKEFLEFYIIPAEENDDSSGFSIYAEMDIPEGCRDEVRDKVQTKVNEYLDTTSSWEYGDAIDEIIKSFDPNARIIEPLFILM